MTLVPGFIVAHSHRLEQLTELVTEFVGKYPLPPLSEEKVLVQSNGIAQWLKINMANQLGISAMVDVTLPARFLWQAYRTVLGDDIPEHSPFDKDRLVWRLMRVLPGCWQDPRFASLKDYVKDDPHGRKLYQLSERLADLFDQYQIYRADWLDSWLNGQEGEEVSEDNAWQPELWRRLIKDVERDFGKDAYWNNRAALHRMFIERASALSEKQRVKNLPERLIVFGISALPQQTLEVLNALKGQMQILLCVHNPSRHFWADIVSDSDLFRTFNIQQQRQAEKPGIPAGLTREQMHTQANPLLASWGKQGRDYIRLLDLFDQTRQLEENFSDFTFELFDQEPPTSLLNQVQDDVLELRSLSESRNTWRQFVDSDDQSIRFHLAHSPQREVEVLHDQLLDAFAADETLRPRDIMVMVPDIDTYAPHIQAVFGRLEKSDPRYIPFTIADQGQRYQEPILKALELLLSPERTRFTMTDVLELLEVPGLCRKLEIEPEEIPELQRWISESGIRWGLHPEQRQAAGMPGEYETNTWLFGIQRILYGYAIGDVNSGELWNGIEPYSEVAGLSASAAGGLAALLESLDKVWRRSQEHYSTETWCREIQSLMSSLFDAESDSELLLLNRISEEIEAIRQIAQEARYSESLPLNVFREFLFSRLDIQSLNKRFLAGAVNFATLMPMRAIPFKRVCLLGMNDGDYPRSRQPYDFDLMAGNYRPGDRSRREDDRYLFLEALLSAREQFYISWVGRSIRDNSELPPSVLVSQLIDHLVSGWKPEKQSKDDWLQQFITIHRLQPFHSDYFSRDTNLFSYSNEWLAWGTSEVDEGKTSSQSEHDTATEANRNLEVSESLQFSVSGMAQVLTEPCRVFCNRRLEVWFGDDSEPARDDEVISLQGLDSWQLNNAILDRLNAFLVEAAARSGMNTSNLVEASKRHLQGVIQQFSRQGKLGMGVAATTNEAELLELWNPVLPLLVQGCDFTQSCVPVSLFYTHAGVAIEDTTLPFNTRIIVSKPYGKVTSKDFRWKLLSYDWVRHLMLNAQRPKETTLVFLHENESCIWPAIDASDAKRMLNNLCEWSLRALNSPLPVHIQVAQTVLHLMDSGKNPLEFENARTSAASNAYDASASDYFYTGRFFEDPTSLAEFEWLDQGCRELYLPLFSATRKSCELTEESFSESGPAKGVADE